MSKQKNLIKYGDIFLVGGHILGCGDARDKEFVDKVIANRKIKAVISDPPFGVRLVENKIGVSKLKVSKNILNDDIVNETEYAEFTKNWLLPILPHLETKNSIYIFNGDPMFLALRQGMEQAGTKFSQLLIWIKSHSVMGRKDYLPAHELLAYGWYKIHEFKKSKDSTLLFCPKSNSNPLHPSQKPVAIIRRLILNSTSIGDTVFDSFAGSGTIGVAAEQTKRKAIMIERDEEYCQTILSRMEKLFGLRAERIKP